MANDLAKKQLRSLLKHSDQSSKLNSKLNADLSIINTSDKSQKIESMQMP
jgi:hypothetical protein